MKLHYFILQTLFLLTITLSSSCQSSTTFPGVYAGVRLSINPLGGGMNRTDEVILFRKDKTFTDQLDKKEWKTAVRGKYEIKGSEVYLYYTKGSKDNFTITKGGNLDAGSYTMFKMDLDNKVPKGSFLFKFVNGSGGIATGTTYVGSSSRRELNFDGAGNFTTDRQSTTVVAGDNIGGGTNSKSDGRGKYAIKDGVLTLRYDNGTTTTHSFFASLGDAKNKTMAVIDGSFYFTEDMNAKKTSSSSKSSTTTATDTKLPTATDTKLPTAAQILTELRKKYGGTAIDNLKTYTVKAQFSGITVISYNDVVGKRFRNEMFQRGKLIGVEQIGPAGGWLWSNGKKIPSTTERLEEAKYNDYIGVMGLQQGTNAAFSKGTVQAVKNGYAIGFQVDGHTFVYVIDKNYTILGDSYMIGKTKLTNTYSNNRTVDGITLPFTNTTTSGKNKLTLNYQSIEINKALATNWQQP